MQETPEDAEEAEKPAKKRLNFRFSFRKKSVKSEDEAETETKVEEETENPPDPYPRQEWKLRNIFKSNKSKENEEDNEIDKKGLNSL